MWVAPSLKSLTSDKKKLANQDWITFSWMTDQTSLSFSMLMPDSVGQATRLPRPTHVLQNLLTCFRFASLKRLDDIHLEYSITFVSSFRYPLWTVLWTDSVRTPNKFSKMEKAFGFNMKDQESISHPFAQQKLPAWQPLISTRLVVLIMICIAIICLPLGIGLLVTSLNVRSLPRFVVTFRSLN